MISQTPKTEMKHVIQKIEDEKCVHSLLMTPSSLEWILEIL